MSKNSKISDYIPTEFLAETSNEDDNKDQNYNEVLNEIKDMQPLDALFYCCQGKTSKFKYYKSYEEYSTLYDLQNIPQKLIDGEKFYRDGLRKILDNLEPYLEQVKEKTRIQSKNIILYYSLSTVAKDVLFMPEIVNNEKGQEVIKILQFYFKEKELDISYLGVIPYYCNLFVYVVLKDKPNIKDVYKFFNLEKINLDIDFVYKVKYNQAEKYDKKIYDYFATFPCNKTHEKQTTKDKQKLTITELRKIKNKFELIDLCEENPLRINSMIKAYDTITAIDRTKRQQEESNRIQLSPWQSNFINEIKEQIKNNVETRKVIWLYDKLGNSGKS